MDPDWFCKVIFVQVFPPLKRDPYKISREFRIQDLRALAPDVEELLSTYQLTLQELRKIRPEISSELKRF